MVSIETFEETPVEFYDEQERPVFQEEISSTKELITSLNSLSFLAETNEQPKIPDDQQGSLERFHKAQIYFESTYYNLQNLIDIVDMYKAASIRSGNIVEAPTTVSGPTKYLTAKHLVRVKPNHPKYLQRVSMKHKKLSHIDEYLTSQYDNIQLMLDKDRKFLRAMANISRRWKIEQDRTILYAILYNARLKPWIGDLDKVMLMRDDESVYKVQLPPILEDPKFMNVKISTNIFEFSKIEAVAYPVIEAKLDASERALRDYTIMKILLDDIEECEMYTVTHIKSKVLDVTVNIPHYKEYLNISFCLDDEMENLTPSKSILLKYFENFLIHKESGKLERFSILEEYILIISHLHLKMKAYQTIVSTLQKLQENYNIQEHKHSKTCTIFEIKYGKNNIRLLDLKIEEFNVYFTAYIKPFTSMNYVDSFLPIHIFTKTDVAEVEFIIAKVLEEQKSIINYKQN